MALERSITSVYHHVSLVIIVRGESPGAIGAFVGGGPHVHGKYMVFKVSLAANERLATVFTLPFATTRFGFPSFAHLPMFSVGIGR